MYLRLDQKCLSRLAEYDDVIRGPLFSLASGPPTLNTPLVWQKRFRQKLLQLLRKTEFQTLRNGAPTSAIKGNLAPYEKWYGSKPKVHHLQVCGCMAYTLVPDDEICKFDSKAKKLRFVGYSLQSKGF